MSFSPAQRKLLMYGIPVVAVLALIVYLRSRSTAQSSAGAATGTVGTTSTADTPIGLDQLASFENATQAQFGQIGQALQTLSAQLSGTTTVAPAPNPTPVTTNPTAKPAPAFNEYPVGTVVSPGEKIVQAVPAGAGYVDVTSRGGLYGSGVAVSGSLISKTPGTYTAAVQGSTVYEYGPSGVGTFHLSGAK